MEIPLVPGAEINRLAPTLYREICRKLLDKFPYRRVTKAQAKRVLGLCFKVGKYKQKVFHELEEYGLLIFIDKNNYYINWVDKSEIKEEEDAISTGN